MGSDCSWQNFPLEICVENINFIILVLALCSLDVLERRRNLKKTRKWKPKKMVMLMPKKLLREQLKIIPWQGV